MSGGAGSPLSPARWKSAACVLALFVVYSANGRESGAGDTLPTLQLPVAILRGDGLSLDRFASLWPSYLPYHVTFERGHIVSQWRDNDLRRCVSDCLVRGIRRP